MRPKPFAPGKAESVAQGLLGDFLNHEERDLQREAQSGVPGKDFLHGKGSRCVVPAVEGDGQIAAAQLGRHPIGLGRGKAQAVASLVVEDLVGGFVQAQHVADALLREHLGRAAKQVPTWTVPNFAVRAMARFERWNATWRFSLAGPRAVRWMQARMPCCSTY